MSDKLVRIKNRYDTLTNWFKENPVLAAGEIGIWYTGNYWESIVGMKIGNGKSPWNLLNGYSFSTEHNTDIILRELTDNINLVPDYDNPYNPDDPEDLWYYPPIPQTVYSFTTNIYDFAERTGRDSSCFVNLTSMDEEQWLPYYKSIICIPGYYPIILNLHAMGTTMNDTSHALIDSYTKVPLIPLDDANISIDDCDMLGFNVIYSLKEHKGDDENDSYEYVVLYPVMDNASYKLLKEKGIIIETTDGGDIIRKFATNMFNEIGFYDNN